MSLSLQSSTSLKYFFLLNKGHNGAKNHLNIFQRHHGKLKRFNKNAKLTGPMRCYNVHKNYKSVATATDVFK